MARRLAACGAARTLALSVCARLTYRLPVTRCGAQGRPPSWWHGLGLGRHHVAVDGHHARLRLVYAGLGGAPVRARVDAQAEVVTIGRHRGCGVGQGQVRHRDLPGHTLACREEARRNKRALHNLVGHMYDHLYMLQHVAHVLCALTLTLRAQMRVVRRLGAVWVLVPLMLVACALSAALLPQGTAPRQLLPGESLKIAAHGRPELAGQDYLAGAAREALQHDDLTDDFLALLEAGGLNASAPQRHGIPHMTNCTAVQWCAYADEACVRPPRATHFTQWWVRRCDRDGVCSTVCKRGSVQVDGWLEHAIATQVVSSRQCSFQTSLRASGLDSVGAVWVLACNV